MMIYNSQKWHLMRDPVHALNNHSKFVRKYCEMFPFLGLLSAWNKTKVSKKGISTVYARFDTDHIPSDVWLLSAWNKDQGQ